MAWDPVLGLVSGNLFGGGANPNTPQDLRQKIALAMLMQKRKAPSTFGEGLSAIGDSLGDIGMMRRIEGDAATAEEGAKAMEDRILRGGGATPQPQASTLPGAAAITKPLYSPNPSPTDQTAVQGDVPEGGGPTGPLYRPNIRATGVPQDVPANAPIEMNPNGTIKGNMATRSVAPPPVVQPGQPPAPPPPQAGPTVANYGQKPILALTTPPPTPIGTAPPVVASDAASLTPEADQQRRDIGAAMMRQQMGAQPPAPAAVPPPLDRGAGIQKAPPPAPPQAAPAQALPEAGYVTPLPPYRPRPSTTTDRMQQIQEELRSTPPSMLRSATERMAPLIAVEQAKVAQAHEEHKAPVEQDRQLTIKHHEQRAAARGSVDAAREAEQRIAKGNIPEVKQDIRMGHTYNPATGTWDAPRIGGEGPNTKPSFKPNEFQDKAMVNYPRALIAHQGLEGKVGDEDATDAETGSQSLSTSMVSAGLNAIPLGVGRPFRSEAYKEADTHADNFVQAFIRQQSGGAYGPAELESEARGMLPKYGDTEKQLKIKREQREQFLSGMHSIIGPERAKNLEIDAAQREAERRAEKKTKDKPAENAAPEDTEILMKDGTIKVKRGGKWVPK